MDKYNVAPFAGAWIEMQSCAVCADQAKVAPFAGAWIEIMLFRCRQILVIVAPFAGAWIEIAGNGSDVVRPRSLPSRERGLKFALFVFILNSVESLPSRERGLKLR